ncbi:MAG: hypothetical protein A2504_16715 [Bdellovibrionales bacterium RIFOXYD12_FULL_39_22]|nr:MAG: hypothetical protein A2385_14570 [Bdellovibrionales bacterium RIFOXYB1_FULL_39_21]OFZ45013.1 MAG: hypothetical protein A2485_13995 [Bdellovibrionales bacterium RIFOXYC12_FULL_39_17]OFZ49451.1 MAG: hypothetical protein A2404_08480 [Bdellovibrionales bacterium RIFOXYC1_FULL_39_130]OFZ68480.1 MAG: hypothetical protein A2451_06820 [Bdellovibrionales bacterium RIFOXYC2_FULL_39_8]OFZ77190.1 MAG: hypothetical protein A2560_08005 [Bdellovibrionales bacterium RIFOXYD1_FULL_39_84]OFZ95635.1 MAG:
MKHIVESNEVFDLYQKSDSQTKVRGLISIPHAGMVIPDEFKEFLTKSLVDINEDVDFKVYDLIDKDRLLDFGVVILVAKIHRVCVDLNRAENIAVLNWKQNTFGNNLTVKEVPKDIEEDLLKRYYRPYYNKLKETLLFHSERLKDRPFPVIDLHSMPSRPTAYHLKNNPLQSMVRPDFCVSDLEGKTCSEDFKNKAMHLLQRHGHSPSLNDPYKGGFITKYINTLPRMNNIQIEINRACYMDEQNKAIIHNLAAQVRTTLTEMAMDLFSVD